MFDLTSILFCRGNSIKVITYTLHIIMFEMFKNGLSDQKMAEEVEHFFASTLFRHVVEVSKIPYRITNYQAMN